MKTTQLTRGQPRRLMYVENKDGLLDGARAWVGWAEFSKTGRTVYFHGRSLLAIAGGGTRGNYLDVDSGEEFWVTGVKTRGSNAHSRESAVVPMVEDDAREEYERLRGK
jgi:hypothetical protein